MLVRKIIPSLLFLWVCIWFYFLISHYIYLYWENKQLVNEGIIYKENLKIQNINKSEKLQSEIDEIVLRLSTLEDIMKNTKKKKKQLISFWRNEQQIKHDLVSNSTTPLTYIKYRRNKSKEEKAVYGKKITLNIPQIKLKIDTLPVIVWDIKKDKVTDDDIYNLIDTLLENGPVRFPWTDIIDNWVTTIYSHSSQTKNIKNYSYFRWLPFIVKNQEFTLTSEFKKYTYIVQESLEIDTSSIKLLKTKYESLYPNKKFIFLITCYPINTSIKRWVVVAEQKIN